jgi:hypothetical protein
LLAVSLFAAFKTVAPALDVRVMTALLYSKRVIHPTAAQWWTFIEGTYGIVQVIAAVYIMLLFWNRKRQFPAAYLFIIFAVPAYLICDQTVRHLTITGDTLSPFIWLGIFGQICIWVPYLRRSRRIRARFVE